MIYLRRFFFPDAEREVSFRMAEKRTCFDTYYPFQVLSGKGLSALEMDHLTILYGGNGSGKTTALNVIAEKLSLQRDTLYNRSNFFGDYLNLCHYDLGRPVPRQSRVITSDDVFDYMLNLRAINQGVDANREEIMADYLEMSNANPGNKYGTWQLGSMEDYETLKKLNAARHKTQSRFVRSFAARNVREQSNGESAYAYFTDRIRENALYLLDEPENSLSPRRQTELAAFLEESVRFYGCQFLIATHSPFLLALRGAKIYDLDADPAQVRKWTDLENVRAYYEFFRQHQDAFGDDGE